MTSNYPPGVTGSEPEIVRELPLVERLRYEAQNNEMVDQYFTEAGKLMNEAADALAASQEQVRELEDNTQVLSESIAEMRELSTQREVRAIAQYALSGRHT